MRRVGWSVIGLVVVSSPVAAQGLFIYDQVLDDVQVFGTCLKREMAHAVRH